MRHKAIAARSHLHFNVKNDAVVGRLHKLLLPKRVGHDQPIVDARGNGPDPSLRF